MGRDIAVLRDDAAKAVEHGKLAKAIDLYGELERIEPASATWPKRVGETHRRAGNPVAAVAAFERAAAAYVKAGFLVQAIAVCKLILQIEPTNTVTLIWLEEIASPSLQAQPLTPAEVAARVTSGQAAAPATVRDGPATPPAAPAPPRAPAPRAARITLSPGAPLDSLDLATLVPGAQRLTNAAGAQTGISLLAIAEPTFDELELVEIAIDLDEDDPLDHATTTKIPRIDAPAKLGMASSGPRAALGRTARLALITTPLFAGLPPSALEHLITRMALVDLEPGAILFREGDPGETLFVISEGEVTVESSGRELARLGAGAFFGEIALITDVPRSATIRAVSRVELLAIDRDVLRDAAAEQPEIVGVLLRFIRDRLVDRVVRTSELFHSFTDPERTALAKRFELVEVADGTPLIIQGERADALYTIVSGRADVWRNGEPNKVCTLVTGDVFGEGSLLAGGGSSAHVRAASRVLALRMPAQTFQEVIMTHPQVLAYLAEVSARRAPRTDDDEFFDLHIDLG